MVFSYSDDITVTVADYTSGIPKNDDIIVGAGAENIVDEEKSDLLNGKS